jgi:hypothetical protein
LVHEEPQVRDYFSNQRSDSGEPGCQCLICGAFRPPVDKHPSIQIRGGSSSPHISPIVGKRPNLMA